VGGGGGGIVVAAVTVAAAAIVTKGIVSPNLPAHEASLAVL
jgi:hypothetical protein